MEDDKNNTFEVEAILRCLLDNDTSHPNYDSLLRELNKLLSTSDSQSSSEIEKLHRKFLDLLGDTPSKVGLISGGATKIKEYVFEASRLPEIRGASALLDWVNDTALNQLWHDELPYAGADRNAAHPAIIYAGGGSFLAFAPADRAHELANKIEQTYTKFTLTANSVAVAETFELVELRYGRLRFDDNKKLVYWFEQFEEQWKKGELKTELESYYYGNEQDSLEQRFYNRKTFGELVTYLKLQSNRRREERAYAGQERTVPHYESGLWLEQCDSSDHRSAVMSIANTGQQIIGNQRFYSEPSAYKQLAGLLTKKSFDEWEKDNTSQEDQSEQAESEEHRFFIEGFRKAFGVPPWEEVQGTPFHQRSWQKKWEQFLELNKNGNAQYALKYAKLPKNLKEKVKAATDIGEITQAGTGGRYIAMLYSDGNNVGRLIGTLKTPQEYAKVSAKLGEATVGAVFAALNEHLEPTLVRTDAKKDQWVHPFEIITIGGDDILVLLPASYAFPVALSIAQKFEQQIAADGYIQKLNAQQSKQIADSYINERYTPQFKVTETGKAPILGLSTGLVIASETTPFTFMQRMVEELLKSAKKKAHKHASANFFGGAIDFMVLKSSGMFSNNIADFRKRVQGDVSKETQSMRRITAKPYSWLEFSGLLTTVQALKTSNFPKSQIQQIREQLTQTPGTQIVQSVMDYLYSRIRFKPAYSEVLKEHFEDAWCKYDRANMPPWRKVPVEKQENSGKEGLPERWETVWVDLIEVYDFVANENE
jgi:CRISPR-associated protein Cmr2